MAGALLIGQVENPLQWEHWGAAKAMLTPALEQSDETWADVEPELACNDMQLVGVMEGGALLAAAITRTAMTHRGEVLEIYLAGGTRAATWARTLATRLHEAGKAVGMVKTRIIGRVGWHRYLSEAGFKAKAVVLEAA